METMLKNCIIRGTKSLKDCPTNYKATVIDLLKKDFQEKKVTEVELMRLVNAKKMTKTDFNKITK